MIGAEQRNIAVRWLVQLTTMFHFSTETFALSVTILDRFLQAVKVRGIFDPIVWVIPASPKMEYLLKLTVSVVLVMAML